MDNTCEIPRWQQLKREIVNLTPKQFRKAFLDKEMAILVDVRTTQEWNSGSLSNALHIDYLADGFLEKIDKLDRDGSYFIFCRTGRRSLRTTVLMKNWGFTDVQNLDGGLTAWEDTFGHYEIS